ncbi:MAG: hypothetical protein WB661_12135, partial [Candidatus Bathyarchaeia archaeon]
MVQITTHSWYGSLLGRRKKDDLITAVFGAIVAAIVVACLAYAFALVLISFGWLAVLGFLLQCGRALYDGKLNPRTVTKFGASGAISGAFGIVTGQLSSDAMKELLSGEIIGAIMTGVCLLISYAFLDRMTEEIG